MGEMPRAPQGGKPEAPRAPAWRRLGPYLILGPVSGPLTAGVVNNLRGGRPFLASMYGFLLASWLFFGPLEVAYALPILRMH
jgi:hypothetical protein